MAGSSLDRIGQSTRNREVVNSHYTGIALSPDFIVSAFDLRQEPSARPERSALGVVVPHAWDLYGGCRATGIPTVTI